MISSKSRAHVVAVPAQHLALVVELLERRRKFVYGAYFAAILQRHLLAAAGDPQRDAALLQRQRPHDRAVDLVVLAVERRRAGRPGLVHDLDALAQHPEAVRDVGEAVAVGAPLVLVPAAADAHLGAAAGDEVDGRGDLGEVGRVAVAMHVHIWPSRMRAVDAANAAISVHASWVASSLGTGIVWKWS